MTHRAGPWGLLATLCAWGVTGGHGRQTGAQGPQAGEGQSQQLLEGEEKGDPHTSHAERGQGTRWQRGTKQVLLG